MTGTAHLAGDLVAAVALVAAFGWVASRVAGWAHTPAPVRRGAAATARTIRHPVREGKKGAPKAAESVEAIWAKVKAQDWLERRQAKRKAKEGRPPRERRRFLPRVVINVPGITSPKPGATPPAPAPPTAAAPPALTPPATTTPAPAPAPAGSAPSPAPTGRPTAMPSPRHSVPPDFAQVIARINGTEHENDHEYLLFVRGLASGSQGIAEACEDHVDHLISGIGLDPAAVKAWHDISDAFAQCAAAITRAEASYQRTYSGATEDASKGTVMPFRGRFITGETA